MIVITLYTYSKIGTHLWLLWQFQTNRLHKVFSILLTWCLYYEEFAADTYCPYEIPYSLCAYV